MKLNYRWALVAFAFAVRALWQYFGWTWDIPDTAAYFATGDALFATGQMTSHAAMPLYPILLHLFGATGIVWLQIVLSSLSVALIADIAFLIWKDEIAAGFAAAALAVHPALIYYASMRLTETLFIFLLLLGICLLLRTRILLASIAMVLATLVRPTLDPVFPLMVIAAAFAVTVPNISTIAKRLGIYSIVYVALMLPWWVHNYYLYGEFVRLDLGAGVTFLLENSRSHELHGFDWTIDPPWAPFMSISNPIERDRAMLMAAGHYALDNPAIWLRGCLDRGLRFFSPLFLPNTGLRQTLILSAYTFTIYLLAILSLIINPWRRLACLLLPLFFIAGVHIATHANSRYRLPIDPLLIVVASGVIAARAGRKQESTFPHRAEAAVLD